MIFTNKNNTQMINHSPSIHIPVINNIPNLAPSLPTTIESNQMIRGIKNHDNSTDKNMNRNNINNYSDDTLQTPNYLLSSFNYYPIQNIYCNSTSVRPRDMMYSTRSLSKYLKNAFLSNSNVEYFIFLNFYFTSDKLLC